MSAPVSSVPCRLLVDFEPRPGAWNMAVDELLLDSAVRDGRLSLRWYRWNEPTVSLGYFQDRVALDALPALGGLPAVRRLTGGGAIVHDRELTYSCAVPASHPLAARPRELYTLIHGEIVALLNAWQVPARLRGTAVDGRSGEFLCFGRGDDFDVVVGNQKILGSAQRRRKGAVLQHGSLVLRRSAHAPQFAGAWDLSAGVAEPPDAAEQLAGRVAGVLSDRAVCSSLTSDEEEAASRLARERYGEQAQRG